jgi:hypothetical protein
MCMPRKELPMQDSKGRSAQRSAPPLVRLFVLELSGGRIFSTGTDGRDKQVLVTDCRFPHGIAVDVAHGHICWTNMGDPKVDDGSIERVDLDGDLRSTIVPKGGTYTPKQMQLSKETGKLKAAASRSTSRADACS